MKGITKTISIITASTLLLAATGCSSDSGETSSQSSTTSNSESTYYTNAVVADQFALPQPGEEYAIITVEGYGQIKVRLFPEATPKAVENFKTLAKQEAYTNVPFHRIVEDFMIQTGDTTLTGGDGKSIYGDGFAVELNESLHHYTGAVAMARTSDMDAGQSSQFYIVSNKSYKEYTDSMWSQLESKAGVKFSDDVRASYTQHGGAPTLDMQYTVFGQVFEGQDIVDQIASVPVQNNATTGEESDPVTPVIVSRVEIATF